ncbi:unnamed protein product, partial [Callosobruchus maculatus]
MGEFEFHKHNQYTQRSRRDEDQFGVNGRRFQDNRERSRAGKRRYEDNEEEYSRGTWKGMREEHIRGNQKGARDRIREENADYSRGSQKSARERIREENEEYSRGIPRGARARISEEKEEYLRGIQRGARERISEENEEYSRSNQKRARDQILEENEEYSRGIQRGARARISEEKEEYLRGIQRGARERIREENEGYSRGIQRANFEELGRRGIQRGARERSSEEKEEYSRSKTARDRIREENEKYSRGVQIRERGLVREENLKYSRGIQGDARERITQENEDCSRGNQRGARDRIREENEEYLRSRRGTRERSFEDHPRGMKARIKEEIDDYSMETDEKWNYEERTRDELEILEREKLELRRLEEKLQSVFEAADSPNGREDCGEESCKFEDEATPYYEGRLDWPSQEHDLRDQQSPGPSVDRTRGDLPFFDRDDESSYHSDDDGPHWQSSQYPLKDSFHEGYRVNISKEDGHITDYSSCGKYTPYAEGSSQLYTGNGSPLEAADGKYKLIIVKEGYPEDLIDNRLHFRKIKREIVKPWRNKRWMALSEEEKAKYAIKSVVPSNGKVVVTCLNSHTRDWLFRYVPFMRPYKGAPRLKTIEEELEEGECSVHSEGSDRMYPTASVEGPEVIPRPSVPYEEETFVNFSGRFFKLFANNDVILRLFQIQNRGIDSSKWEVVNRRVLPNAEGVDLTISVDATMAKVIALKTFKLYCGYHQVDLQLQVRW